MDQIDIKVMIKLLHVESPSAATLYAVEDDFRAVILKLFLLDATMEEFPSDGSWSLMTSTVNITNDGNKKNTYRVNRIAFW